MNCLARPPVKLASADELAQDADVIIVGSGPAGMSAAVGIASVGFKVIVLDMQPMPGGQIFRSLEANLKARPTTDSLLEALGPDYVAGEALIQRFRATPGIDYRPDTTVWDLRADGTVGWLKGNTGGYLRAKHVVVASGAMERPAPFSGWTLPGVMTAGAVQTLLKAGRLKPDGRIVLAGTGPLIFLLADQLRRLGIKPVLVARTDSLKNKLRALPRLRIPAIPQLAKGLGWLAKLHLAGIPMKTGVSNLKAIGVDRIEEVSLVTAGKELRLACDLLIVHDGVIPSTDLAHCAGLKLNWCSNDFSWAPVTSDDGQAQMTPGPSLTTGPCRVRVSGDARRIGGADAAMTHGRHVALSIIAELQSESKHLDRAVTRSSAIEVAKSLKARPFIDAAFPLGLSASLPADDTIVCRCEEITAGALREKISEGTTDMNHLRGVMRCGMGPCQGRSCSITVARLLQEISGSGVKEPAPFRARPPIHPIPLAALATLSGLDPELSPFIALDDKPAVSTEDNHA